MSVRLLIASRVVDATSVTPLVRQLRLAPIHRDAYPTFRGGDHVQVQLGDGMRRDYSLCGSPQLTTSYEVAVRREDDGRGGSKRFHSDVSVGDEVYVSYPQPGIRLDVEAGIHVFIAGGIGVTAILGLLHELPDGARGIVHYCVRARADAIFLSKLESFGIPVAVHVSSEGGRLDVAAMVAECDASTTIYHCGPPALMDAVDAAAGERQIRARSEAFAVLPPAGERLGNPFRAVMLAAGTTVEVGESETLLRAMLRADVPVEFSCEGGVCGACVVEVREGEIDHRDRCLSASDRAGGMMTACVSRAQHGEIKILL